MVWLGIIIVIIIVVIIIGYLCFFRQKSVKSDLSFLPTQFVVFDLETTGLNPEKHEIIEISAVRVNVGSDVHDTFTSLVRSKKKVPKRITEITGITSEMLETQGDSLEVAIGEFIKFAGNLRLVAFNAPFDYAFLSKAALRFGITIDNPVSCALDMARRAWPKLKSYKLAKLANTGGLDTKGIHRALKDCELTVTVYAAAAAKLRSID
jgi:DNA polymerase III epsilon subunit family exonuclease